MTTSKNLQYCIHDDTEALRLELSGNLSGVEVDNAYHAWLTEYSRDPHRPVIVDLTFVTSADHHGLVLISLLHRSGAQMVVE